MKHDFFTNIFSDPFGLSMFRRDRISDSVLDFIGNNLRGKTEFNAVCLSGGATAENASNPTSMLASYYPIRVRPLDIHDFIIPDPCGKEYANDPMAAKRLIDMHPIAYGIRPATKGDRTPGFGDILTCKFLIAGPEEQGKLRGIRYLFPKFNHTYNYECANAELQSLVGQFRSFGTTQIISDYPEIPGSTGPSALQGAQGTGPWSFGAGTTVATPNKNYPPCASKSMKKWTKISRPEFARKVKKIVSNRSVAISIIAIVITEQPSFGGPNHNLAGVMADGGSWGAAGKTYIKCSVPSTEGAGGSGNRREKIRWFAAYESFEDFIKFMNAKIKNRSDKDENGKPIAFVNVNNGTDWAKLHTLRWLSPTGKRQRIKNKSKMASKARNWETAKRLYNGAAS